MKEREPESQFASSEDALANILEQFPIAHVENSNFKSSDATNPHSRRAFARDRITGLSENETRRVAVIVSERCTFG